MDFSSAGMVSTIFGCCMFTSILDKRSVPLPIIPEPFIHKLEDYNAANKAVCSHKPPSKCMSVIYSVM